MSKYKVGDKIVMEITKIFSDNFGTKDYIVKGFTRCDGKCLNEHSEPLSTYTEPLEDKIRRQAEEITRLLAENKELKEESKRNYTINIEMAKAEGHSEAWELARKIVIPNGYSSHDLYEIFESNDLQLVLEKYTYPEAIAKVAEWEKVKEEIKIGDIVKIHEGNDNDLCVLYVSTDKKYYNAVDEYGAVYNMLTKGMITKTGRHIDIDNFLKQIGENGNER